MLVNMFQVPIFRYSLDWSPELKKDIINKVVLDKPEYQWKNGGVYTDYKSPSKSPEEPTFPHYYEYMLSIMGVALEEFYKEIDIRFNFKDMFYQLYKKGSYHLTHNHGPLGYSGILFVSFNKDVHTATRFYSPFLNFMDGSALIHYPVVKEGDLLIWPASLLHEAPTNESEEERIVVSFNLSK